MATADHRWLYAGLFLIGIWMSIPPPFSLWRWIYWVPGLNFVRVPSRFTVVGMLGLGLVAAAGLDGLMRGRRAAVRVLIATAAAVLFIAESAMVPLDMVQFENDATPIDRWAASLPPGAALLDMPMSDSLSIPLREQWTTRIMLHSMSHWKPVFVGFSGIQPPGYMDNYWKLVNFPDAESLATARRLGITHVILHMGKVDPRETAMVEAKYAQFAADVTLVHTEGEGRVYAIRP